MTTNRKFKQENLEKVKEAIRSEYPIKDEATLELVANATLEAAGKALIMFASRVIQGAMNGNDD